MDLGELGKERLDEIEVTHRDAATGDDDVTLSNTVDEARPQRVRIIGSAPSPDDTRADLLERRDQAEPICIADLTRAGCLIGLHQFVPGGQDTHSGAPHDLDGIDTQAG